jgi:hypothetical protein
MLNIGPMSDLSAKIDQGDPKAEEWTELSLDSVMASFIHMDAAVDARTAEAETMAVNVAYTHDVPQSVSSFTSQLSSSNPDFTLSSLKSLAALGSPPLPSALAALSSLRLSSPQIHTRPMLFQQSSGQARPL